MYGAKYEGEIILDLDYACFLMADGKGTLSLPDSKICTGSFDHGLPSGILQVTSPQGSFQEVWKDGELINTIYPESRNKSS